jgi:hypothetical protein
MTYFDNELDEWAVEPGYIRGTAPAPKKKPASNKPDPINLYR